MKPIEIIVIIAAVAVVAGVIIASVVRKVNGKPSLASDCGCCPHAKECNGKCSACNEDVKALVEKRKRQLEDQKSASSSQSDDSLE